MSEGLIASDGSAAIPDSPGAAPSVDVAEYARMKSELADWQAAGQVLGPYQDVLQKIVSDGDTAELARWIATDPNAAALVKNARTSYAALSAANAPVKTKDELILERLDTLDERTKYIDDIKQQAQAIESGNRKKAENDDLIGYCQKLATEMPFIADDGFKIIGEIEEMAKEQDISVRKAIELNLPSWRRHAASLKAQELPKTQLRTGMGAQGVPDRTESKHDMNLTAGQRYQQIAKAAKAS